NRCAAAKLKATGKKAKTRLGCDGKAIGRGLVPDPACRAQAEQRFVAGFAKAEARPPCLTTGATISVETLVGVLELHALADIPTTPPPPPPVCGDGQLESAEGEQCDGDQLGNACNVLEGETACFPPGDPHQCQCCIPPGGQGTLSGSP